MRLALFVEILFLVRGQLISRGLSAETESDQEASDGNCKCGVTWYRRVACVQGDNLKQRFCVRVGCCYHDDKQHNQAPKCYQQTGVCPAQECRVKTKDREACKFPNRVFIPRHTCEQSGCCYDLFAKPNCYKSTSFHRPAPYQRTVHPYFAKLEDRNKPHLFHKFDRLGPFRFISSCFVTKNRCGKVGTTRSQCIRFGCCWQPNYSFGVVIPECYRSARYWLNYPVDGASWESWSSWSQCTGNQCLTGAQQRTRSCKNDYLPHMKCSGSTLEARSCNVPCPGADWGPYLPGPCISDDEVCLRGTSIQTRSCFLNGMSVPSTNCIGSPAKTVSCNTHLCHSYGAYTAGSCSVTCGEGVIPSTRECLSPVTSMPPSSCTTKHEPCNPTPCPRFASWSDWSACIGEPCSKNGRRTRTRTRQAGSAEWNGALTETMMCTTPCNADWGDWIEGSCQSSEPQCLVGTRTDTRVCVDGTIVVDDSNCIGSNTQTVACNTHLCDGSFTDFTSGVCSMSCGGGTMTSTRQCLGSSTSLPTSCVEKVDTCNTQNCPVWGEWSAFDACIGDRCSNSGTQSRSRSCVPPQSEGLDGCLGPNTDEQTCTTSCNADWGDWIEGSCQSSEPQCLVGTRTDTRVCMDGTIVVDDSNCIGSNTQTVACNTHLCDGSFTDFTSGVCSMSCGRGTMTSTRQCLGSSTSLPTSCVEKVDTCNPQNCPVWGEWSAFDACIGDRCSNSGTQSRSRSCVPPQSEGLDGCLGPNTDEQTCTTSCNADWGDWIEGSCQSSEPQCLVGTRTDTRVCMDGTIVVDDSNCIGSNTQTVACNTHLCDGSFTDFTSGVCSMSCGRGTMTSTRQCLGSSTSLPTSCVEKVDTCNPQNCPVWGEWSAFDACIGDRCSNSGTQSRSRSCVPPQSEGSDGCLGPNTDEQTCTTSCNADWGDWIEGSCQSSEPQCLVGTRTDTRVCMDGTIVVDDSNCIGSNTQTVACNTHLCDGSFTDFTSGVCSMSCGGGTMTSTRQCLGSSTSLPTSCVEKVDTCNSQNCPVWGEWSAFDACIGDRCSNSGIQSRSRSCVPPQSEGLDGCLGPNTDEQTCTTSCNADWGDWIEGSCQSSEPQCLVGTRTDTRVCMDGTIVVDDSNCIGSNTQTVACNTHLCDGSFTDFTSGVCSMSCGGGTMTSTRQCLGSSTSLPTSCVEKVDTCNSQNCPVWGEWSAFDACIGDRCSNSGTQSRSRSCVPPQSEGLDGCLGPNTDEQTCTTSCNADWGDWIEGSCQSSEPQCLVGTRTDTRVCMDGTIVVDDSNCIGSNTQTVACNTHLCDGSFTDFTSGVCSMSCGRGTMTSTRQCLGSSTSLPTSCVEKVDTCNPQNCPVWGEWSAFDACIGDRCSNSGTQSRSRSCVPPQSEGSDGCLGPNTDEQTCTTSCNADWGDWIEGSCQSSEPQCLVGTRTDTRVCMDGTIVVDDSNCIGSNTQTVACNTHLCDGSFTDFTSGVCSMSCGGGTMTSTRQCLGSSTSLPTSCVEKVDTCNSQNCPVWGEWSAFDACIGDRCSNSGIQSRSRSCVPPQSEGLDGCLGPNTDEQTCTTSCNADWGDWIEGSCQSSEPQCLVGTRTDTRVCMDGTIVVDDSNCIGSNTQTVACNTHLCDGSFTDFTSGVCSMSCGGGTMTSTRQCLGSSTSLPTSCVEKVDTCNSQNCPVWGEWSAFDACIGDRCSNSGTQSRSRSCVPPQSEGLDGCLGPNTDEQTCTTSCNADWGDWIEGSCQSSEPQCLVGTRTDTRVCMDRIIVVDDSNCIGSNTQTVACNTQLCDGSFTDFTSGVCSMSCGGGTMTSTRQCLGSSTSLPTSCVEQTILCNTQICPKQIDVAFLFDGSSAVGQTNFNLVLAGASSLVANLDLANGNTRVGAIRYDDQPILQIFPSVVSLSALQLQLLSIVYREGDSALASAIMFAATRTFDNNRSAKRVAIIYANGPPTDAGDLIPALAAAQANSLNLFVVAFGSANTNDFLSLVGGDASRVVLMNDLTQLSSVFPSILAFINS